MTEEIAAPNRAEQLEDYIKDKQAERLRGLAIRDLDVNRLAGIARIACAKNPDLIKCGASSILMAIEDGLRIGLEPDGIHGALIPYGRECTFQPMFKGLARIAREEGAIVDLYGECVRAVDVEEGRFDFHIDENGEHISYRPSYTLTEEERGDIVGAFVVVTFAGNVRRATFKPWPWIVKRRKVSRSAKWGRGPWFDWPEEMAIKTVVKAALKTVSGRSVLVQEALRHDDAVEVGETIEMSDPDPAALAPPEGLDRVALLEAAETETERLALGEGTDSIVDADFDDAADAMAGVLGGADVHSDD